jgi:uncharacterized damage-inducible protein DinB
MLNAYDSRGKDLAPADLLAHYAQGPADLEAALAGLSQSQLTAFPTAPGVGTWSILQVVGHLADCEQFLADRMKRTIALERPLLVGVDENRYLATFAYHGRDLAEEHALIRLTRSQMLRILRPLPADAWQRAAIHTEAGLMTLHKIVFHAANHLPHHVRFIHAKRQHLAR